MKKRKFKKKSTISLLLVIVLIFTAFFAVNPLQAASTFKAAGYISPDLTYSTDQASTLKSGFLVQITGTSLSATTDQNGYFEVQNIPTGTYTIKISKQNFLYRELKNIYVNSDIRISSQSAPVDMWPGDMPINGSQDNAINMTDIMEIARVFNASSGSANYITACDLNRDNAINMTDIMALAKHFNKVPTDYPSVTVEYLPTPTPNYTNTPLPTTPLPTLPSGNYQVDTRIRVNSIGFLPDNDKKATITASTANFYVLKDSGAVAYYGTTTSMTDPDTNTQVWIADFSNLKTAGTYYLAVPNVGKSVNFKIGTDVYNDTFKTSMLGMYLARCGTAVSATYNGNTFSHAACHTNDGYLDSITGQHTIKDGKKGWHDAGDYNKYVVNAGITVGSMLFAWEQFQDKIKNQKLTMPENTNSMPDYLDEIKWETDWLLTMQYPDGSGKVSHKLTTKAFGDFILPEQESAERFFTPWGSAATADFVAMMAMASRAFRPYDSTYADKCINAAIVSYNFLKSNPSDTKPNQTGYSTGGYDTTDPDDRLWAAAEMWETLGDSAYLADFETRASALTDKIETDFDWGSVNNLGMFTYLLSSRTGKNQTLYNSIKSALVAGADSIVSTRNAHGYGRPLGTTYYWGCNGSVARLTMILQIANQLSPKSDYVNSSLDALGYLLGRNYYCRSFITGVGVNPPLNPHHRPSGGDSVSAPWPGYLVGGGWPTAKDWTDKQDDYKTNEIAINWNAALIYALAGFVDGSK